VRTISIPRGGTAGFLRLPLLLPEGMATFESQHRARTLGIAPTYPTILPRLPQLTRHRVDSSTEFPGATALVAQLITLPTHSLVSPGDVDEIVRLLRAI
jgi:dTDP-4-amino-4,6-dideoxygalactose transaminase